MKQTRTLLILACAGIALSACTAYTPPAYRMHQTGKLQAGAKYTVRRGENLYAVAQKHGVRIHQIVAINKLRPPYYLKPGTQITIPVKQPVTALATPTPSPLSFAEQQSYLPPEENVLFTTERGLAGTTSVSSEPLAPINLVPKKVAKPKAEALAPLVQETIKPSIEIYDPPVKKALSALQQKKTTTRPTFGWPIRGTIISTYGPKGGGRDNDGINISAPKGAPVKASEAGTIVYAGNGMKGFGNLVLIKHNMGWVTAYAHMQRITVKKDDILEKGNMIGTVGSTGGVSSPQLHFEARREGVPVDPELMIK